MAACLSPVLQFTFEDNKDVLDLIEGRRPDGILPILDDQIRVRNGNDSTFYKNIVETHAANPKFKRVRKGADTAFGACRERRAYLRRRAVTPLPPTVMNTLFPSSLHEHICDYLPS